jgi:hypothetical protein
MTKGELIAALQKCEAADGTDIAFFYDVTTYLKLKEIGVHEDEAGPFITVDFEEDEGD